MKAMTKHRSHSAAFKRQVAQEFIAGETLHGLSKRHDLSRQLIRIWVGKYEAGALDDDVQAADLLQEYEAKIAALEKRDYVRRCRPRGLSIARGCRLMGLPRSTFYDAPAARLDDAEIVGRMQTICDEFEAYGYRRVGAELRHQGIILNHKKIRRLMREHGLQPKRRRRYVATTDSEHDSPVFPDRARDLVVDGPNQLWVADITYIAITGGFVYLAALLDAWSRRVVGYAISRSIDARLALAALKAAIQTRNPPEGCVHHSDRLNPAQYASEVYRQLLA